MCDNGYLELTGESNRVADLPILEMTNNLVGSSNMTHPSNSMGGIFVSS